MGPFTSRGVAGGRGGGGGRMVKDMIRPFFQQKKYMADPIFLDWYVKGPTFLTSR